MFLIFSFVFPGLFMVVVSLALDSHGITNDEKVRTLLAGYTFIGFALLCFQTVTSCPLRGLFSND